MSNECASSSVVADEQAISLIVDGVSLSVPKGATILDAAEKSWLPHSYALLLKRTQCHLFVSYLHG